MPARNSITSSRAGTQLLISVFGVDEVDAALAGGADIVDVKNPAEGSLGAPTPGLLRAVRSRVAPPIRLSAALGDAPNLPGTMALAAAGAAACGADYLKIGLLGASRPEQALALLVAVRRAAAAVNPQARLVAVAYADAFRVGGLPPAELPLVARDAGVYGVMLDTALKDAGSAWSALGEAGTAAFVDAGRSLGLATALAGGLAPDDIAPARRIGVDIVGFRGSACEGGRNGAVSAARVQALRAALEAGAASDRAVLAHP